MINSLDYFNSLYDNCIRVLKEFGDEGRRIRYILKRDGFLSIEDFYGTGGFTISGCKTIEVDPSDFFDKFLNTVLDDEGYPVERVERVVFSGEFLRFNTNQLRRYLGFSALSLTSDIGGCEICLSVPENILSSSINYPSIYDMIENKDVPGRTWGDVMFNDEEKNLLNDLLKECIRCTKSTSLNIFKVPIGFVDYAYMYDVEGGGEYRLYADEELLRKVGNMFERYDEVVLFRLSKVFLGSERVDRDSKVLLVY